MKLSKAEYRSDPCRTASIPYWKAVRMPIPEDMRIVHDEVFSNHFLTEYTDEPYFRLKHDLARLQTPQLPEGYALRKASCREYAAHIRACYTDIGISEKDLLLYTQRRVYCEALWIAVWDENSGSIAATGIGEFDQETGEGVLEWIQVSPEHRRKGLGTFLVLELLRRMKPMADFTTVSGQCKNATSPELLYRRCGFSGQDIWHILRRKHDC